MLTVEELKKQLDWLISERDRLEMADNRFYTNRGPEGYTAFTRKINRLRGEIRYKEEVTVNVSQ